MIASRVLTTWLKVLFVAAASTLGMVTVSSAHEVQPAIANLRINDTSVDVTLTWVLEAPLAGLDLEGLSDTNAAENAEEYDRFRALSPTDLERAFREDWPRISGQFGLAAAGEPLAMQLGEVDVPEEEILEFPRISRITLSADLPPGDGAVTMTWPAAFGPLVVRQVGVENGYSLFLMSGGVTDPISRAGPSDQSASEAFVEYVGVGFEHIIPLGLDHILFVLGLFFLALRIGPLLWQVTAFTLAHTVTLALGALDIIRISPDIVEPLIAASIVYVGVENVLARELTPWRPFIVFGFGLLHGLGFAGVLSDFGLGASHFVPKLIGFNVGVEIGQLAVIAAAFVAFGILFGRSAWYFRRIAAPVSIAISLIAVFWVLALTGIIDATGPWAAFAMLTEGGLAPLLVLVSAGAFAAVATGVEMVVGADLLRDVLGALTSFVMFLAVVATFTSGAWLFALALTAAWILAIRLQSLGEDPDETAHA
ncbi:MAG: HupE/UreJ family protein [Pseudomonadota bacterium]